MDDTYAIATHIRGRRYFWHRTHKVPTNGHWVPFGDCTLFTAAQRKRYPLPKEGQWVSVLHGMGMACYPADSELTSA